MKKTFRLWLPAAIILFLIIFIASISLGSVYIPFLKVVKILIDHFTGSDLSGISVEEWEKNIIINLRIARTLLGVLSGASLAICGLLMQALTKNPLADPYILGIASGASTGAVIIILLGNSIGFGLVPSAGAFAGAMTVSILVFLFSAKQGNIVPTRLVLIGVAISSLFSSFTNLLVFTAKDISKVRTAMFWMTGSLAGAKYSDLFALLTFLSVSIIFILVFHRSLNALLMGEETAQTLGIDIKKLKISIIIIVSLLTGLTVAATGIIGFIGLIIPHMARSAAGSDHKKTAALCIFIGPCVLLLSDIAARMLARPEEIPIGVVTSFIGAPFFIYMLRRSRYSFGGKNV